MVGMKMMAWAKMIGITPALLTFSGRTYGATIRDRLLSAGIEPTVYFRSPFTIEPQTSVEVKLLFMTPAYGSDLMDKLLPRFAKQGGYNYSLIIKDRISGRSIDIPIADYHGA